MAEKNPPRKGKVNNMGFRDNAWLTVWDVRKNPSGKSFQIRASTSKKNRETDEYETDWSGFINLVGGAAKKASVLKQRDRIQMKGCEVTTRYVKEKDITYTNYTCFDFEMSDLPSGGNNRKQQNDEYNIDMEDTPF